MGKKHSLKKLNLENLNKMFSITISKDEFSIENILKNENLMEMGLRQAIVYNYDSVLSGNVEDITIDLNNIIEGRFFNENIELKVFNDEDNIKGTIFAENIIEESGADDYIEENYILYQRDKENDKYPKTLKIKKYIDYDEDNQAYICYMKPCKLIF